MRAVLLVAVFVSGCVEPAHDVELRVTYRGVRSTSKVEFPSYSHQLGQSTVVNGVIVSGDAAVASARIDVDQDDDTTLSVELVRAPDDDDPAHLHIVCTITEAELGHATECLYSRHACSIVAEELP